MKAWLKGGLIGGGIGFFILLLMLINGVYIQNNPESAMFLIPAIPFLLILGFIIGSIIGLFFRKKK